MDLNDYWQENKRFVACVAGGVLAFAIGQMAIGRLLGDELRSKRSEAQRAIVDLGKARYGPAELASARSENAALVEAVARLGEHAAFRPRPGFVLDPRGGSPSNQYFSRVQAVRERLLREAGRAGLRLEDSLGQPKLAPTREEDIARHLEGLDLIERVCDIALGTGVQRIEAISIELDPALTGGRASGPFERTKVKMKVFGPSRALAQLVAATQDPARGPSLLVHELTMIPVQGNVQQAALDVSFLIVRLRGGAEES